MKNWYSIKTKSRQENTAKINLENQEYTTYCPIVNINKKNVVLFPGYLFIYLDRENENWSPIRSTKGVSNFVRFGLNFAQVPESIIEFIKTNQSITSDKIKKINSFKNSDKVRITDGNLKTVLPIFKSIKSDDRVILLINLLGQEQVINIKKESLIRL
jgi:transcriptional antiterminator RfaH